VAPEPNSETKKKDVVWFALDEDRSPFCFAGICTEFRGDRGTKSKPVPDPHLVYTRAGWRSVARTGVISRNSFIFQEVRK
jgi:hypothetical protein